MAWSPISNTVPQYSKNAGGAAAADYYLKFYADGTTTPINMATDSTGGTTLAKCQLDSLGYPTTDGSTIFVPHIDQDYKLALYTNSTDADNNTLASAAWVVDNLSPVSSLSSAVSNSAGTALTLSQWFDRQAQVFSTVSDLNAATEITASDYVIIENYSATNNSGPMFGEIVAASTGTDDGGSFIDLSGSSLQFKQHFVDNKANIKKFGAEGDGTTIDYTAIQNAMDYIVSLGGGEVYVPSTGNSSNAYYIGSNTLLITGNSVSLVGENKRSSYIKSDNVSTLANSGTTARFYVDARNIYFESTANSAKVLDFTYFKHGTFEDCQFLAAGGSNPSCVYGTGTAAGSTPYYNIFKNCIVGPSGATGTIIGYNWDASDIGGGTIRGPNSNIVMGGRVSSCTESIRVQAGNNNTFLGVASEAVLSGGYDITLGEATAHETGTATGGTTSTLINSGASFTTYANGAVYITGGTGAGQVRKIASNSSNTIFCKTPWETVPDATSTYQLFRNVANNNTFINNRAEGSISKAGVVRRRGGEYQNEILGMHSASLGSGTIISEDVFDFSNINLFNGQRPPTRYSFYQDDVAASQSSVQINATGSSTEYLMPSGGEIVAISVNASSAVAAGTLTVKPSVNGTAKSLSARLDSANGQINVQVGKYGDNDIGDRLRRLGVEITTDSGFLPVTTDITVDVWVQHIN